jgi:hypothetical protein
VLGLRGVACTSAEDGAAPGAEVCATAIAAVRLKRAAPASAAAKARMFIGFTP